MAPIKDAIFLWFITTTEPRYTTCVRVCVYGGGVWVCLCVRTSTSFENAALMMNGQPSSDHSTIGHH